MLETMSDFFTSRTEMYDEHMLTEVEGCKEGYVKMASLLPDNTQTLLDLGCGTGLELEPIFDRFPRLKVVGIDLTESMLEKLKSKFPDKDMKLICGDYFQTELGETVFDCAVSFQTMHHFQKDKKLALYKRLWNSLKDGGAYIECDYMVLTQDEEDHWFGESDRLRREQGIVGDEFYHYDTPCTVDNQIELLKKAGFGSIEMVFRIENTTIIIAKK